MISRGRKPLRQAFEQSLPVMKNFARFAMHQSWGANDLTPEDFTDSLMAEAHTKYWNRFVETPDHVFGYSGIRWSAGTGRNDDSLGLQPVYFFKGNLVVPEDA
jgi:hypothetical protein